MTISVNTNLDGSYTVTCGTETVIVGRGPSGKMTWPASPGDNGGGVRAYLAVGDENRSPPRHLDLQWHMSDLTHKPHDEMRREILIAAARAASRRDGAAEPVAVGVALQGGQGFDLSSMTQRLHGAATSAGVRVGLHFEVVPAPRNTGGD
jgi:hypothetical protein